LGSRSTIEANLLFEPFQLLRRLLDQLRELRVLAVFGKQLAGALEVVLERPVARRQRLRRLQLAVLAPDVRVALALADHRRVGHLRLELGEARLDLFDQRIDHASQHRRARHP
jgi:hypothetical protein